MNIPHSPPPRGRIVFRSPMAFYLGCLAVTCGVGLHFPMFIQARSMHYMLANMAMDPAMLVGMGSIVAGLLLAAYGLAPPATRPSPDARRLTSLSLSVGDDVELGPEHWKLIVVLGAGLIIDVMKPASLAFVLPGMRAEYGLSASLVTFLPFSALAGTVVGSIVWGRLSDAAGRRATILFASLLFMGTSICGAMPAFGWNVCMCFLMGAAAGGLLPVAMTLLTEILPTRYRAVLVVLLGGVGAAGGYLLASSAATLLIPTFSWRIMWFLNLPTGLILVVLNRFIPESPRFLLLHGRSEEAAAILRSFHIRSVAPRIEEVEAPQRHIPARDGLLTIIRQPHTAQTIGISLYGLAWGLINYGFLLWLPANLQSAGLGGANGILAISALIAFPGVLVIAWLYGFWSSRRTMVLTCGVAGLSLLAFLPIATSIHQNSILLTGAIVALLISSAGMTATLLPYSAEVYPTSVRATGTGVAAASGKLGGLAGQGAVLAHVAPTLTLSAISVAATLGLAVVALGAKGRETRGVPLLEFSPELPGVEV